ncbi:Cell division protein ZipA [Vibrio aerogenes CECT 7868]|uniref:Cell division protein ZipA n=1 Tax=Vibrio aerogenes CECT 7868 TaxID=1216006 RepID=A0A1M5Z112_9VIBR|nr:cell division protein ZipA [Vibrio aerogenes]SHI17738.1 Cell division protein ZipA [Vibrio aerogenes CECT 7868]
MQELRFVLIIVGALAIAALLFHGLWTSKKEAKSKFGDKPLDSIGKHKEEEAAAVPSRGFQSHEDVKHERKEPGFLSGEEIDPLIDGYDPLESDDEADISEPIPPFSEEPVISSDMLSGVDGTVRAQTEVVAETHVAAGDDDREAEPDYEVIVLNVHCAGDEAFTGTKLFDSMQQNGLLYGEMEIYHRHADLSGTGKVLFSVANIMQPGSLRHDAPEAFSTKGISFFMTLPCYGDPEQNFKLMLKTAQQIADDLGGNVLDDRRNLMTPDRLGEYRRQIQAFKSRTS